MPGRAGPGQVTHRRTAPGEPAITCFSMVSPRSACPRGGNGLKGTHAPFTRRSPAAAASGHCQPDWPANRKNSASSTNAAAWTSWTTSRVSGQPKILSKRSNCGRGHAPFNSIATTWSARSFRTPSTCQDGSTPVGETQTNDPSGSKNIRGSSTRRSLATSKLSGNGVACCCGDNRKVASSQPANRTDSPLHASAGR